MVHEIVVDMPVPLPERIAASGRGKTIKNAPLKHSKPRGEVGPLDGEAIESGSLELSGMVIVPSPRAFG